MNRSGSEAVLSSKPEQDHAGTAEYLLELLTVDEIAAALRVSLRGSMSEYANGVGIKCPPEDREIPAFSPE
jgi:hypothetical protein